MKLADIYYKNYSLAMEKRAKWGSALMPPIVMHELSESEEKLAETVHALKICIEYVTEKEFDL